MSLLGQLRKFILVLLLFLVTSPCFAAINFDGGDDFLVIEDNANYSALATMTVSSWVNFDTLVDDNVIIGHYDYSNTQRSWALFYENVDGAIVFRTSADGNLPTQDEQFLFATTGQWFNIVVTYNAGNVRMFLNGVEQATAGSAHATLHDSTGPILIGASGDEAANASHHDGLIDDTRVYDRILSDEEIFAIYSSRSKKLSGNLANGLVVHYEMDDKEISHRAGQAQDDSGNLNHGNFVAFANLGESFSKDVAVNAVGTRSLFFDGTNNYVEVADNASLDITDELTLSAWVKRAADGVYKGILQKGPFTSNWGLYEFHINNLNKLTFSLNNNSATFISANSVTASDGWVHVAVTYDRSLGSDNMKGFINGTQDSVTTNYNALINTDSNTLRIGEYFSSAFRWQGGLDDIRVYNRALSPTELSFLYDGSGLDPGTSNLQALWAFEDSAVKDSSGNNNHAVGFGGDSLEYTDSEINRN